VRGGSATHKVIPPIRTPLPFYFKVSMSLDQATQTPAQMTSIARRLEQYTLKRPQEVLLISVVMDGSEDEIAIFKGFSSSLMCPTAFDPEVPVLAETAEIVAIARLKAPYNPDFPQYIQQQLSLAEMEPLLAEVGV
jgi:hypothetical protein